MSMTLRRYYSYGERCAYQEVSHGLIQVTHDDGRAGLFRADGRWVEGPLRDANLHMLIYTGGPNTPREFNYHANPIVPADIDRPSGWPEQLERMLGLERRKVRLGN
jgi:hypothetical protein